MTDIFYKNFNLSKISIVSNQKNVKNTAKQTNAKPIAQNNDEFQKSRIEKDSNKNMRKYVIAGIFLSITTTCGIALFNKNKSTNLKTLVSDLFLEDFTSKEVKEIAKKYKNIAKINNTDELLDKLFASLKNDFKLNTIPIKLNNEFKGNITQLDENKVLKSRGECKVTADGFEIRIKKDRTNEELIKTLTHEMRHAKQHMLEYQISTREEMLNSKIKFYKDIADGIVSRIQTNQATTDDLETMKRIKDKGFNLQEIINNKEIMDSLAKIRAQNYMNTIYNMFKNCGVNHITSTHKNYEIGKKFLNSHSKCTHNTEKSYTGNFNEIDARKAEEYMLKLMEI